MPVGLGLAFPVNTQRAQRIYYENAAAVAYVAVQTPAGDSSIGSAFHVGEGVFITARHCVEGMQITEVQLTEPIVVPSNEGFPGMPDEWYREYDAALAKVYGHPPMFKKWLSPLELLGEPVVHEDEQVDLAAFRVANLHPSVPVVKLGVHWDDWVHRRLWNMSCAVVLGYPPIPMTREPVLVSARGEIHAFVVPRHSPHVHFILSSTARGGFSGGPAIHEDGYALGVVTSSLVRDALPSELGFQAVLSIEPIRKLLEDTGLLPRCQREIIDATIRGPQRRDDAAG